MSEPDPVLEALNRAAEECSPQDIDNVIAYLRKSRAAWENGEKPKKNDAPALTDLLKQHGVSPVKVTGTFIRRI